MKNYTDVIEEVVVTEKSAANAEKGIYTFKVAKSANKIQIKDAVEKTFGVKVASVNTLNTKAKSKRVGRYTGTTKTYKKAVVTLKDGQQINL
ncbi:MAG: 50S ribosomal protein L23 [Firmicutes bacterium]|jgi:large subunit ribosomal protein L23|nr:50S ribosomal protein L23 [Bacillota bacterium]